MVNKEKDFDAFLEEISKAELLSSEAELQLVKAVQAKGVDCDEMQRLEKAHARFIVSVANQYKNHELSIQDLIAAGEDGLRKAAMKYDTESDFKFLSYAVWWVRQAIIQAIAEHHEFLLQEEKYGYQMKMAFHFDKAREGHKDQQMALAEMILHGDAAHYFSLIKPTDKKWLMELAEKNNHVGAIYCLLFGMHHKLRYWNETFVDDDTKEEVTVLRCECIDGSVFEKEEGEEECLIQKVMDGKSSLSVEELKKLCREISDNEKLVLERIRKGDEEAASDIDDPTILQELCEKGNKYAAYELYYKHRWGDEANGIFINRKQAREYYDLAGDIPFKTEWDDSDDPGEEDPSSYEYVLTGNADTLDGVKQLIDTLCQSFGIPENVEDGLGMFVPQRLLMKVLVGADTVHYRGNIQEMKREAPDRLVITTEADRGEPLLYALRQCFTNLEIEMKETEW